MLSFICKTNHFKQLCDVSVTKNIKILAQSISSTNEKFAIKTKDVLKNQVVEYRHVYPEFLPDPKIEFRNSVREKLERSDMVARRTQIDIPEFYVELKKKFKPNGKPLQQAVNKIKEENALLNTTVPAKEYPIIHYNSLKTAIKSVQTFSIASNGIESYCLLSNDKIVKITDILFEN